MDVIRATPFEYGTVVWPLRPEAPLMLVVVKATFDLRDRGAASIRAAQETCTGPAFDEDDPDRSLRYPGDFDPLKPRGECFLIGSCHPPGGEARASEVTFGVGSVKKTVAVFGDRHWKPGLLGSGFSAPEPFTSMPLSWERAFGGPGFAANPFGRGATQAEGADALALPNLEDPAQLVDARNARPAPAGFGPIHPTAPSRLRLAGTYGPAWTESRFPHFPVDLDPAYFLWSPPDQRSETYWRGDETISLRHLHPEHPRLETRLPGLRPRAFVIRRGDEEETLHEVQLKCDTIVVDAERLLVSCVYRGLFPVADAKMSDVRSLFLLHERLGAALSAEACQDRLDAELRRIALEEAGFAPLDPADDEDAATIARVLEKAEPLSVASERAKTFAGTLMTLVGDAGSLFEDPPKASEPPPLMAPAMAEPPGERAEIAPEPTRVDLPDERAPEVVTARLEDPTPLRARALMLYAEGRPWEGDFAALRIPEEALDDLVATRAILDGADLGRCSLRAAKLGGASLCGARLSGADLTDADLEGADLTGATLDGAVLSGANLAGAVLEGASFERAILTGATLAKAEARGARFIGADLEDVDATELDLTRGSLREARCRGAIFLDARLAGADASFADLSACTLEKLRAYDGARFEGADLRQARGDGARFGGSSLANADLSFGSYARADFSRARLTDANLDACHLRKAKLRGADLTRTRLRKADLMQAKLAGAILSGTDLRGANLFAAELHEAILDEPRLDLANLEGTKLEGRA